MRHKGEVINGEETMKSILHKAIFQILGAIFFLLFVQQQGLAETKNKKLAQPSVGQKIDFSSFLLPKRFQGNNIVAIYNSFSTTPKGEYETTEQYRARIKEPPAAYYAFKIQKLESVYDADEKGLTITFLPEGLKSSFIIYEERDAVEKYVGENGYGGSREVSKISGTMWVVMQDEHRKADKIDLFLGISPDEAKRMKKRLTVFLVCEVGLQNIKSDLVLHEPTTTSPIDATIFMNVIAPNTWHFWLTDYDTGKVLGKYDWAGTQIKLN